MEYVITTCARRKPQVHTMRELSRASSMHRHARRHFRPAPHQDNHAAMAVGFPRIRPVRVACARNPLMRWTSPVLRGCILFRQIMCSVLFVSSLMVSHPLFSVCFTPRSIATLLPCSPFSLSFLPFPFSLDLFPQAVCQQRARGTRPRVKRERARTDGGQVRAARLD